MSRVDPRLSVALVCAALLIPSSAVADEVEDLRAELAALRADYEKRIDHLESRLADLSAAHAKAAADAVESNALAQKAQQSADEAKNLATENQKKLAEWATTPNWDAVEGGVARGFAFHGYLRSGFGLNERGEKMVNFQVPYSLGHYRLGNEPGTYAELVFDQNWINPSQDPDKAWFKTEALVQADTQNIQSYDPSSVFRLREAFAQAGNILNGRWRPTKFWAGNRYYQREDIYILDYYIRDMSGYGGGIESIPLGFATVDVAYIGALQPSVDYLTGNASKSTIDVRAGKIKVPGGRGALWYDYAFSRQSQSIDGVNLPSAGGNAVGFEHRRDEFHGGYHLFTFQAAGGAASNLSPTAQTPTPFWRDSRRYTMTDSAVIQLKEHFAIQPVGGVTWYKPGEAGVGYYRWLTFGARPIYSFNTHMSIAAELGFENVVTPTGVRGWLRKLSLAPQIAPTPDFFSRPVLRAFVTLASWSPSLQGIVGGPAYATRTSGLSAGLQVESWW